MLLHLLFGFNSGISLVGKTIDKLSQVRGLKSNFCWYWQM
jgi:hypothetical protein